MRIPVVFLALALALASPAFGEAAASEDCRPRFFDEVKAGLASAGGAVGSSQNFPTGVSVTPESGQIQDIAVRVWSVYGCAVPKVDFDVEGDDIDIGALHGVVTVMQAVFLEPASSEADMEDISTESLVKLVRSCMKDRPRTYSEVSFRRAGYAYNRSVILNCWTEATASGVPRTHFMFDRDPSTIKQQSAN